MFVIAPVKRFGKSGHQSAVCVPLNGTAAVIEMQVGQENISNILGAKTMSSQAFFERVVSMQIIVAKELFILLVAKSVVDQDAVVAVLDQQAAHSPGTKIPIVGGIGFVPKRFWNDAEHSASVELKISGID